MLPAAWSRLTLHQALLILSVGNLAVVFLVVISGRLPWTQTTAATLSSTLSSTLSTTWALTARKLSRFAQKAPLVCIFTSFTANRHKAKINGNTLHNWASLNYVSKMRVQPILYVDSATTSTSYGNALVDKARHLGWTVLPVPRVNSIGLPYLKDMYAETARQFPTCSFYGFCNGDILFNRGVVDTLAAVRKRLRVLNRTMVIGRRINVLWNNISLYRPYRVEQIARKYGRLHLLCAEDYFFIARNDFPWKSLPDVVIARRGYDNFLVIFAMQNRVSVVDATETLIAVHQTDNVANATERHSEEFNANMHILGNFSSTDGLTANATYVTASVSTKSKTKRMIIVRPRESTAKLPVVTKRVFHRKWG